MTTLPSLTVCRGCCCGTDPGSDPDGLLDRLRTTCGDAVRVRTSECLGPCERADVVVVNPSASARATGARSTWVARVSDAVTAAAVADWVNEGGPGAAEAPPRVRARIFRQERAGAGGTGASRSGRAAPVRTVGRGGAVRGI